MVELLDKGNRIRITQNFLRLLPWRWTALPEQSLRCSWADLEPPTPNTGYISRWDVAATASLRRLMLPKEDHNVLLRGASTTFRLFAVPNGQRIGVDQLYFLLSDLEILDVSGTRSSIPDALLLAGHARRLRLVLPAATSLSSDPAPRPFKVPSDCSG